MDSTRLDFRNQCKKIVNAKGIVSISSLFSQRNFKYELDIILTQEESRFYLINQRNSIWLKASQTLSIKVKQTIDSKKVTISAILGIKDIISIIMFPPGEKFNKQFFF